MKQEKDNLPCLVECLGCDYTKMIAFESIKEIPCKRCGSKFKVTHRCLEFKLKQELKEVELK